ncbi:hypothetical protein A4X13_0g8924 [Tilletia indica]|uniref:Uncharacterized protein n=1 Tax=Tilletia indica TaxID=43049 RepID=A0A8T8SCX7_9BASI|nr:hypothetical protein A4X13_0g8924 [Tilletia indica]
MSLSTRRQPDPDEARAFGTAFQAAILSSATFETAQYLPLPDGAPLSWVSRLPAPGDIFPSLIKHILALLFIRSLRLAALRVEVENSLRCGWFLSLERFIGTTTRSMNAAQYDAPSPRASSIYSSGRLSLA